MGKGRLPVAAALFSDLLPTGDHVVTRMGAQDLLSQDGGEMSGNHTVTMRLTKRAVDALVAGPERLRGISS